MRSVVLLFSIAVAFRSWSECISPTPPGREFFAPETTTAFARVTSGHTFVVERVLRGPVRAGDTFPFLLRGGCCPAPISGKSYLVSRRCFERDCGTMWVEDVEIPRLLMYLRNEHRETRETLFAKATAWIEGSLSLDEFRSWIQYAGAAASGNEQDDNFAIDLADELEGVAATVAEQPQYDMALLRPFLELTRTFPAGSPEEVDRKVDEADPDEPLYREDYERRILDFLRAAQ